MSFGDHLAAEPAGARTEVDHVVGAQYRVFVVLDHQQRVALVAQLHQCVEQYVVVPRVQADGRLVKHVADASQVGT